MSQYKLNKPKFVAELEANPGFAEYCKKAGLLNRGEVIASVKSSTVKKTKKFEGDK